MREKLQRLFLRVSEMNFAEEERERDRGKRERSTLNAYQLPRKRPTMCRTVTPFGKPASPVIACPCLLVCLRFVLGSSHLSFGSSFQLRGSSRYLCLFVGAENLVFDFVGPHYIIYVKNECHI